MDKKGENHNQTPHLFEYFGTFLRRCVFSILSVGPIPRHIAFIMDGNRRFANKQNLEKGAGHKFGFSALMTMLKYCYEFDVKYVTIYAFSIDNFKRPPEEVESTMQLIQEKIESLTHEESIVNRYGVRVYFIGNLKLLSKPVKKAAKRAMKATSTNSRAVLSICIAYTSTDEIKHAIQETCVEKLDEFRVLEINKEDSRIDVMDIEKNLYMRVAPDPDIIVRTSGETRLSNFLLWQSASALLYSPEVLWPEVGFRHLVWAILKFQRNYTSLGKKQKEN